MGKLQKQLEALDSHFEELCAECNGRGHLGNKGCYHCDSTGYLQHYQATNSMKYDEDIRFCAECNGQGHMGNRECHTCGATGLSNNEQYHL